MHFFLLSNLLVLLGALLCLPLPAFANEKPFGLWVQEFEAEARANGISQPVLDLAFNKFSPIEKIIELDRFQPESTKTLSQYLETAVSDRRVSQGQEMYNEYKGLLEKIGNQFGVQPRFIVALWGIETNYGQNTGGFNVPRALATLAYDGRRADFFRDELLKSLQIIQAGHVPFEDMNGSWAGAMGQCQFMPSSYFKFAVDYDGNGHANIWTSQADVFASIANYLAQSGWDKEGTWGRRVRLPAGHRFADKDVKPLVAWKAAGVKSFDGSALPDGPMNATLQMPSGEGEGAYLTYGNYEVLLKWNRSRYFATAVGTLSDRIYYGR
ncbi:MAG: lytic murein transglycosylase [Rickettsiales bacterium]